MNDYEEYAELRRKESANARSKRYVPDHFHSKSQRLKTLPVTRVGEIAKEVIKALTEIKPFVFHAAISGNSVYLKFEHYRYRTVRISDHPQGKKRGYLKYRWNICVGYPLPVPTAENRFFYTEKQLTEFYIEILKLKRKSE